MDDRTATVGYRIRFDEAGPSGLARPSLFLRLAQDIAWIHSERIGYTRAWYEERGLAWLVRAVAIEVSGRAHYGDVLDVTTNVIGYRRIWARRRTDITRDGDEIATVLTDWILTDARGRPARIPSEFADRLPGLAAPIQPLRADEPPDRPPAIEVASVVRSSELDPLGHVNNAAYLDRILDLAAGLAGVDVLADGTILEGPSAVIEYLAAAGPGEMVIESMWSGGEGDGLSYRMAVAGRGSILRAMLGQAGV